MTVTLGDKSYEWHYLHPCALMIELCKAQTELGDCLRSMNSPRLAFYMDEIKPGNVLRPDASRTISCWYFTLLDLPPWFQTHQEGWFFFGCFPTKYIQGPSDYSHLFRLILEVFFSGALSFDGGFPLKSSQGIFLFQARMGALMCDEKALCQLWGLRGASGTKPCVLGHMTPDQVEGHHWLVHYSCPDRHRFAPLRMCRNMGNCMACIIVLKASFGLVTCEALCAP